MFTVGPPNTALQNVSTTAESSTAALYCEVCLISDGVGQCLRFPPALQADWMPAGSIWGQMQCLTEHLEQCFCLTLANTIQR